MGVKKNKPKGALKPRVFSSNGRTHHLQVLPPLPRPSHFHARLASRQLAEHTLFTRSPPAGTSSSDFSHFSSKSFQHPTSRRIHSEASRALPTPARKRSAARGRSEPSVLECGSSAAWLRNAPQKLKGYSRSSRSTVSPLIGYDVRSIHVRGSNNRLFRSSCRKP